MLANELEDNGLRESPTMHGAAYASARAPRFAGDDLDHELRMAAQLIMENAAGHANKENVWAGGAFGGGGVGMAAMQPPRARGSTRYQYRGNHAMAANGSNGPPLGNAASHMYNMASMPPRGHNPYATSTRQQAFSQAAVQPMTTARPATAGEQVKKASLARGSLHVFRS